MRIVRAGSLTRLVQLLIMKTTKHKKLTHGQNAILEFLSQHPKGDFTDLCRACRTTAKPIVLVRLGLISEVEHENARSWKEWRITEFGAKAYSSGRYELNVNMLAPAEIERNLS